MEPNCARARSGVHCTSSQLASVLVTDTELSFLQPQVKKFAAKVARQQGRTEDKQQLQSLFKSFLKSDR